MHILICMFICIPKYNILRVYNFTHVYVFRTYHLILVKQLVSSLLRKNISLLNILIVHCVRLRGTRIFPHPYWCEYCCPCSAHVNNHVHEIYRINFGITRILTLKENSLISWLLKSFCLKLGSGITHL